MHGPQNLPSSEMYNVAPKRDVNVGEAQWS